MLHFLPAPILGVFAALLLVVNILFWVPLLLCFALVKLILPFKSVRMVIDPILVSIAESWISGNKGWINLTQKRQWDVEGIEQLPKNAWYMVNSNHQSWVDILVLQYLFNRHIPLLKFFLKQELIWVPLMGLAWWALEFPFMRRHSREYLRKFPEMRGKDQETTRKACEKFSFIPTSVMNFLEGTRFTREKHTRQHSPYKHLLKPKAGGIALALNAMGEKFKSILDVTIVYPDGVPSFWDFLCGKTSRIVVRVQSRDIPQHLLGGNYSEDAEFRAAFSQWVNELWAEKDQQIDEILKTSA